MPITKDDVLKIAELARLELTPEESESFTVQLDAILGYIDKLDELDTREVAPMSHSTTASGDTEYSRRDDVARPSLGQQSAVANAPDSEAGYFKVPKVIGN
ncbi:MAG: Asp-tRNA(Asn)/Glu-tRNA(Gln) amidotransferase subunit GatC [Acidobacteria bacterium]|nr:Asp-tRNA(Asn)/Glu-tRNA(Gln) amidotransferase subunit GatC [Acidobacteriota bacterium]